MGDVDVEQTTHEKQAKSEPVQLLLWLACPRHDSKTPTANLCVCVCVYKGMLGVVSGVMMRCQNHVRVVSRVGGFGEVEVKPKKKKCGAAHVFPALKRG